MTELNFPPPQPELAPNHKTSSLTGISLNSRFSPPRSAYIHIPFCRRRCFYCDFPISVLGDHLRGETSGTVEQYLDWLAREIEITPVLNMAPLETVFFGGGTPSLLSIDQVARILNALDQRFGLAATAEISMEMDPGTFDLAHLQGYLALGINRISLGVQAFQDTLLEACGRTHRRQDVLQSVEWMHQVDVPGWSLDLISGLPHQTLADWEASLAMVGDCHPHHVSVYDLTVEPQTVFARRYRPGDAPLPLDEHTEQMYRRAAEVLPQQGYQHYEISNYAQKGYQCRHNLTYWRNQSYYGFGMGATSYLQGQRVGRPRTRQTYLEWVTDLEQASGQLADPPVTAREQLFDRLMVGLRLAEGIALEELHRPGLAGEVGTILTTLQPYLKKGWALFDPAPNCDRVGTKTACQGARLRLSAPDGFLFSNVILVDLLQALERLPAEA